MTFRQITVILFCTLTFCLQARAADYVNRRSGEKRVSGTITGSTKTEITVKPAAGSPILVPANEVQSVDWDNAPSLMKLGNGDEKNGKFPSALEKFQKVADDIRPSEELIKADLEFLTARVTARMALTDAAQGEEAVKLLAGFLKLHADNFRYFETQQWLGQVYLARQDFSAAREAFEALGDAPWNDYRLSAKILLGRVLLSENKPDDAIQMFDEAIAAAGDSDADRTRKYAAMVGKARGLILQNRPTEALPALEDIVEHAPADNSELQAEAYVLRGNCLQATNQPKEAVLAYLHVDVLFPSESAFHAEALYHLAKLWKTVQHPDRSLEAQAKLEATYPNSDWTKKLEGTGG